MAKYRLYVDTDGTLAFFNNVVFQTLLEKGYFLNLPAQKNVLDAVRDIILNYSDEIETYGLTHYLTESPYALGDKDQWYNEYLPELDADHRIYVPYGTPKTEFITGGVTDTDFLLDDNTKNLIEWERSGGQGIKLLNEINHTRGTWEGNRIRFDRRPDDLSSLIVSIISEGASVKDERYPREDLDTLVSQVNESERVLNDIRSRVERCRIDEIPMLLDEADEVNSIYSTFLKHGQIVQYKVEEYHMATEKKEKQTVRDILKDRFLEAINSPTPLRWTQAWADTEAPKNAINSISYKGNNRLMLMITAATKGYTDPRWCTFKQAQDKGWHVNKGEKATPVEYFLVYQKEEKHFYKIQEWNHKLNSISDPDDKQAFRDSSRLVSKVAYVFNAAQISGIPELRLETKDFQHDKVAEGFIANLQKNMNIEIRYSGDQAFYRPSEDYIQLPPRESFFSPEEFYGTALHELSHSTGAVSRMNRDTVGFFGSEKYAEEELRAEIASTFLCSDIGIQMPESVVENHMAYVQSWAAAIKKDPNVIFDAIKEAQAISDYMDEKGELEALKLEFAVDRKITRLNSSHTDSSRMPSSA